MMSFSRPQARSLPHAERGLAAYRVQHTSDVLLSRARKRLVMWSRITHIAVSTCNRCLKLRVANMHFVKHLPPVPRQRADFHSRGGAAREGTHMAKIAHVGASTCPISASCVTTSDAACGAALGGDSRALLATRAGSPGRARDSLTEEVNMMFIDCSHGSQVVCVESAPKPVDLHSDSRTREHPSQSASEEHVTEQYKRTRTSLRPASRSRPCRRWLSRRWTYKLLTSRQAHLPPHKHRRRVAAMACAALQPYANVTTRLFASVPTNVTYAQSLAQRDLFVAAPPTASLKTRRGRRACAAALPRGT